MKFDYHFPFCSIQLSQNCFLHHDQLTSDIAHLSRTSQYVSTKKSAGGCKRGIIFNNMNEANTTQKKQDEKAEKGQIDNYSLKKAQAEMLENKLLL